jgi:NAD(P)-dependent dehydrogenase (short-subunit alcohol dehydrogenase family)
LLAVNVVGAFLGLRGALRVMSAGGAVVNTASSAALRGSRAGAGVYAASKAALRR